VPLALEYEAVLTRPEHLAVSGFGVDEAVNLVKSFCRRGELVDLPYLLRPRLRDPDDEFVLETAFHGKADVLITFNAKDFLREARVLGRIDIYTLQFGFYVLKWRYVAKPL
jgi:predicted nucleic acid-binding protein